MRGFGFLTISRLAGAFAAIWLCCTGSAWAGGGGVGSVESTQGILGANGSSGLCHLLGMTSCPQLPTLTQLVLQFAALQNAPPDTVRGPFGPPPNLKVGVGGLGTNGPNCSVAGNYLDPTTQKLLPPCNQTAAISSINPPLSSAAPPTLPLDPSSLALELGFKGVSLQGTAVPVPAGGTPSSYFTAVTSAEAGGQLDTLNLYYQYPLASTTFPKGQQVAAVSFPEAILNSDGTETPIIATLQLNATCTGGTSCLTATVLGTFSGNATQKVSPDSLGVKWTLTPTQPLATLLVQVPLLVTLANDEAYFGVVPDGATVVIGFNPDGTPKTAPNPSIGSPTNPPINQVSGIPTAFTEDALPQVTSIKGVTVAGIPPYAAPEAPAGTAASSLTTSSYGFCASFWESSGATKTLNPAVAAFASVGTNGTAYSSSSISAQPLTLTCPF
jgi:hypothetical protein